MRYPILFDTAMRLLLPLIAITSGQCYAEITRGAARFRFGWAFNLKVPLAEVEGAQLSSWPFWWNNTVVPWLGIVGLSGRGGPAARAVEMRLQRGRWVRVWFFPWRCRRICVTLQEPEAFLAELQGALAA